MLTSQWKQINQLNDVVTTLSVGGVKGLLIESKMANENDSTIISQMMMLPQELMAEYFARNASRIIDDSTYWNVLGTLWKLGGTVVQQDLWKRLFSSPRRQSHKIMKSRERRSWRNLPKVVTAYRAVNDDAEIQTAISWTMSKSVAENFSDGGKRKVVIRQFRKEEVFAFFDRRHEDEILVNIKDA